MDPQCHHGRQDCLCQIGMFGGKIGLPELLVVFAIGLLIFGPSKLAGLGKSLGEGIRGFKSALSEEDKKQ